MEYEIFSKRQQRIQGENPDTYQYETIPDKLRVQIFYIWGKIWGTPYYNNFEELQVSQLAYDAYKSIESTLREEYGVLSLDGDDDPDEDGYGFYRVVRKLLLETEDTNKVIDIIEVSFRYIDQVIRDISYDGIPPDEAIDQLNQRFREHSVGYQYESGQIVKGDSPDIHSEVVKPAEDGITQLDLKDYDRQDSPLEKSEVNASRSDFLSEHEFHPAISPKVWSNFLQDDYDTAVFQAFKQVEVAVRNVGNYEETDIGVPLMRKAFHADTGNLTNPDQQSAEKEAIAHLFAGAIGYCKNPSSHREVEITAEEAIEMIALASLLLRIADSRSQSDGDWQEQFANGFAHHLKNSGSPLIDPEVFMGEDAQGYPLYIGFNIGKIENLNIRDRDAFWLVASTVHAGRVYLKLHMNDSNCFNQLESQKAAIQREFGEQLKWEHENKPHRIGVDFKVKPLDENRGQWNQHFEAMREKLEKLNEIFLSRIEDTFIEDTFSEDDIPF